MIDFIVFSENKESALQIVINKNSHLDSERFYVDEEIQIVEGYVSVVSDESYDE